MGRDGGLGTEVWSAIDHGFRYLFFDSFVGWLAIGVLVCIVAVRVVVERRQLP
jgi:hypothetical protein